MHKYKCLTCKNNTWYSSESSDTAECPTDETHIVKEVKRLNAEDYMEFWGCELEDENRHSLTDMPGDILYILEQEIKDKKILRRIMKRMYENRIGM